MASSNGEQERSQAAPRHPVVNPRSEGQWPLSGNLHRAIRTNIILAQGPQYNNPSPLNPPLYMNSQPHLNPTLAPANHTAAFAGLVGQQQTPAIQARSMLPPPLPQPRLAPHNQFRGWAPGLFFPIQLDRTYNLFPVVPQNHPRGSLDLSMAPPDFFTNYWATEPRWDLNLDQLRALVASQDRVAREAPAQQVQSNQAAPALQAPPAIPAWRLLYQVSPFEWGLAEVLQVLSARFDTTQFMPSWEANHRQLPDRAVPDSLQNNSVCTVCSYAMNMFDRCVQCQVNFFEREAKFQGILWMTQVYGSWKERIAGEELPSREKEVFLLELTMRLNWLNERQEFIWKESLRTAREAELKHPWYCICQGGSMYEQATNSQQGTMQESEVTADFHSMEEERQAEEESSEWSTAEEDQQETDTME